MLRAWIVLAAAAVLIPVAEATPGALDRNSCHFCTVDCELYGLQVAEYHCHLGNDRSVSFSYQQFWRLQRILRRAKHPTLREIARVLRDREEARNTVVSAKLDGCYPTLNTATGEQKPPMIPRYAYLGGFGELMTAFACKNPIGTTSFVNAEGNVEGGLQIFVRRGLTTEVRRALTSTGFTCANPDETIPCTQWVLEDESVPAISLKPLLSVASQLGRVSCLTCESGSSSSTSSSSLSSVSSMNVGPISSASSASVQTSPPSSASSSQQVSSAGSSTSASSTAPNSAPPDFGQ